MCCGRPSPLGSARFQTSTVGTSANHNQLGIRDRKLTLALVRVRPRVQSSPAAPFFNYLQCADPRSMERTWNIRAAFACVTSIRADGKWGHPIKTPRVSRDLVKVKSSTMQRRTSWKLRLARDLMNAKPLSNRREADNRLRLARDLMNAKPRTTANTSTGTLRLARDLMNAKPLPALRCYPA